MIYAYDFALKMFFQQGLSPAKATILFIEMFIFRQQSAFRPI